MIPRKLVSVIIVTYNSSPFIVEALESVFRQTWEEIELIITDDGSRDDTVEICRNWLNLNSKRFVRCEILASDKNTGIPANGNRGVKVAKGDWIKGLGGDDTLKPNCIEDNIRWVSSYPEVKALFSRVEVYRDTFDMQNLLETIPSIPIEPNGILFPERSAESQYRMLLISERIHFTPSFFLHREALLSVGGFDERFKLLEDYPLWLNLTKNGHKLFFMDKITVNYRRHAKAICRTSIPYLINPHYFKSKSEEFRKVYTYPYLPVDVRLKIKFFWYASQLFKCEWINKNKEPNIFIFKFITSFMNPFRYYILIRKRLNKNLKNNEFYFNN